VSQLRKGKYIVGASRAMPGDPRRVKEVRRPLTGTGTGTGGEQRQRVLRALNTHRLQRVRRGT